ncbi:MAG: hypothetical protein E7559_01715 [Ruminococcaceae bacterium]|nr:hypothetical protein [Oscillospiraceae bacterium]
MKKRIVSVLILLCVVLFGALPSGAVSAVPDVVLVSDCKVNSATMHMIGTVHITVNNTVLINPGLKLSYHIYDTYGDLMYYEGERIPLVFEGNEANVPVDVALPFEEKKTDMRITFDIIDEQNLYWFSTDPNMYFETAVLDYGYDPWKFTKGLYRDILSGQLPQLIVNVLFWGATVAALVMWKKAVRRRKEAFAAKTQQASAGEGNP